MTEAILHHQYIYTSERLLREIYDKARASELRWQTKNIQVKSPFASVDVQRRDVQPGNIYWLSEFALHALDEHIGSLSTTGEGLYLRAELPLTWALLPVMRIESPVAWMYAKYDDPDAGKTLVALCGSPGNYRGFERGSSLLGGWFPSTPAGLRAVMEAMAEGHETEARKNLAEGNEDAYYIAATAENFMALPRCHVIGAAYMEVLAEVLFHVQEFKVGRLQFDTIILGAPLWVRTVAPRPLRPDGLLPQEFDVSIEEHTSGKFDAFKPSHPQTWLERVISKLSKKEYSEPSGE